MGQLRANWGNGVIWPHLLHLFCSIQILPTYFKLIVICIKFMFRKDSYYSERQIIVFKLRDVMFLSLFFSFSFQLMKFEVIFVCPYFVDSIHFWNHFITRFMWDNWGQIGEMGWFDLIYCIFFASYRFCLHTSSSLFVLNLCSKF